MSSCGTTPIRARIARAVRTRIQPEHAQRAAAARRHAGDHPHGGGLAGAVGPEEAEHLAAAHVHVDPANGLDRAEALAQSAGLDQSVPHAGTVTRTPDNFLPVTRLHRLDEPVLVAHVVRAEPQRAGEHADLGPAQPGVVAGQPGAAAGGQQQLLDAERRGVPLGRLEQRPAEAPALPVRVHHQAQHLGAVRDHRPDPAAQEHHTRQRTPGRPAGQQRSRPARTSSTACSAAARTSAAGEPGRNPTAPPAWLTATHSAPSSAARLDDGSGTAAVG